MKKALSFSLFVLILMSFNSIAQDNVNLDLPRMFSYQGLLINSDGTTYDGTFNVTFEIISDDEQQTLFTETVNSLEISEGLISHNIGSVADDLNPLIFQNPVKLRLIIEGDTLTPFTDIALVPIAMNSIYAQSLRSNEDPIEIQNKLKFTGSDTSIVIISDGDGPFIYAEQILPTSGRIESGKNKQNKYLNGVSESPIHGKSNAGFGVTGTANEGHGVLGESETGFGILGISQVNDGVRGTSDGGDGVSGSSEHGNGVNGISTHGDGVHGYSTEGYGVYGKSSNSTGGYFDSNTGWGIKSSGGAGAAWFQGKVKIDGEFECNGVKIDEEGEVYANSFHINGEDAQKFAATSDGNLSASGNIHSEGNVVSEGGFETLGGLKVFPDGTSGVEIDINPDDGIVFSDPSDGTTIMQFDGGGNWSSEGDIEAGGIGNFGNVLVSGDLWVEGAKNAVVETQSHGKRKVYCDESTEVYFFDRGESQLENGIAVIYLDPVFIETVTINDQHKMLVQITPTADCKGLFVAGRYNNRFIVKELMNGSSNASFMWEVAAKRKNYEKDRLSMTQ